MTLPSGASGSSNDGGDWWPHVAGALLSFEYPDVTLEGRGEDVPANAYPTSLTSYSPIIIEGGAAAAPFGGATRVVAAVNWCFIGAGAGADGGGSHTTASGSPAEALGIAGAALRIGAQGSTASTMTKSKGMISMKKGAALAFAENTAVYSYSERWQAPNATIIRAAWLAFLAVDVSVRWMAALSATGRPLLLLINNTCSIRTTSQMGEAPAAGAVTAAARAFAVEWGVVAVGKGGPDAMSVSLEGVDLVTGGNAVSRSDAPHVLPHGNGFRFSYGTAVEGGVLPPFAPSFCLQWVAATGEGSAVAVAPTSGVKYKGGWLFSPPPRLARVWVQVYVVVYVGDNAVSPCLSIKDLAPPPPLPPFWLPPPTATATAAWPTPTLTLTASASSSLTAALLPHAVLS